METESIKQKVEKALNNLYAKDLYLFEHDLCERCIQHKFANYLEQENFGDNFFVDCEYNRAYSENNGGIRTKKITSDKGNAVDIVVTKRNDNPEDDLACFELKKWNSSDGERGFESDRNKIRILIGQAPPSRKNESGENKILKDKNGDCYCFSYTYGFFIIFGKTREAVKMEFFKNKNL